MMKRIDGAALVIAEADEELSVPPSQVSNAGFGLTARLRKRLNQCNEFGSIIHWLLRAMKVSHSAR